MAMNGNPARVININDIKSELVKNDGFLMPPPLIESRDGKKSKLQSARLALKNVLLKRSQSQIEGCKEENVQTSELTPYRQAVSDSNNNLLTMPQDTPPSLKAARRNLQIVFDADDQFDDQSVDSLPVSAETVVPDYEGTATLSCSPAPADNADGSKATFHRRGLWETMDGWTGWEFWNANGQIDGTTSEAETCSKAVEDETKMMSAVHCIPNCSSKFSPKSTALDCEATSLHSNGDEGVDENCRNDYASDVAAMRASYFGGLSCFEDRKQELQSAESRIYLRQKRSMTEKISPGTLTKKPCKSKDRDDIDSYIITLPDPFTSEDTEVPKKKGRFPLKDITKSPARGDSSNLPIVNEAGLVQKPSEVVGNIQASAASDSNRQFARQGSSIPQHCYAQGQTHGFPIDSYMFNYAVHGVARQQAPNYVSPAPTNYSNGRFILPGGMCTLPPRHPISQLSYMVSAQQQQSFNPTIGYSAIPIPHMLGPEQMQPVGPGGLPPLHLAPESPRMIPQASHQHANRMQSGSDQPSPNHSTQEQSVTDENQLSSPLPEQATEQTPQADTEEFLFPNIRLQLANYQDANSSQQLLGCAEQWNNDDLREPFVISPPKDQRNIPDVSPNDRADANPENGHKNIGRPSNLTNEQIAVLEKNPDVGVEKMRRRSVYTADQKFILERVFMDANYIVRIQREALSSILQLSERQIKIWFQNRRIKERKNNIKKKKATVNIVND